MKVEERMPFLPHEEVCPIGEQLLFTLYDAAKRGLLPPVSDVPPGSRSSVAIFCFVEVIWKKQA